MKKSPFDNLPELTQEEALRILSTPVGDLKLFSDYYKAAFHLVKYPGVNTENALIDLVKSKGSEQAFVIGRRKAIDSLAKLGCKRAISIIGSCLNSKDPYLVENAAWALKELGCKDKKLIAKMISLLDDPLQNRRILIKSISSLGDLRVVKKIRFLLQEPAIEKTLKTASIAALSELLGEKSQLNLIHECLRDPMQNNRHSAIYDLIDSRDFDQLGVILMAPVSPSFRLLAIEKLWPKDKQEIMNLDLLKIIDSILVDHPDDLDLLHRYDCEPSIGFLVEELFGTDFSRCYLALKTLINSSTTLIEPVLRDQLERARKDYGALYFFSVLFLNKSDWTVEMSLNIEEITGFCLSSSWPDVIKFRPISILNLKKFNSLKFVERLSIFLDPLKTPYWFSRYAALHSAEALIKEKEMEELFPIIKTSNRDSNWFVRLKYEAILRRYNFQS